MLNQLTRGHSLKILVSATWWRVGQRVSEDKGPTGPHTHTQRWVAHER